MSSLKYLGGIFGGVLMMIAAILLALYIFVPQLMPGPGEIIRNYIVGGLLFLTLGTAFYLYYVEVIKGDFINSLVLAKIYEYTEIKKEPIWKEKLVECLKEKFSEKVISQEAERLSNLGLIVKRHQMAENLFRECYVIEDKEMYLAKMVYDKINSTNKKMIDKIKNLGYTLPSDQKFMNEDKEKQFLETIGLYKEDLSHIPFFDLQKIKKVLEKCRETTFFCDSCMGCEIEKVIKNIEKEEEVREILSSYRG